MQLGLMVAQALTTKWDFVPHVSLTMNRLPHQIAPLAAFLAVMVLWGAAGGAVGFSPPLHRNLTPDP
jgi:hypothetical protein